MMRLKERICGGIAGSAIFALFGLAAFGGLPGALLGGLLGFLLGGAALSQLQDPETTDRRMKPMPNAFQFIDKKTHEAEKFSVIDDKLRLFLGVDPDPLKYYRGWYDGFGYAAANGMSFAEMRKNHTDRDDVNDPGIIEILKMLDWFDEHYTINAWYFPK